MKLKILYNNQNIWFKTYGNKINDAIWLLHGYLESAETWNDFAISLSKYYFVVSMDLPGHGDSETDGDIQTMESMAGSVRAVADCLGINKLHLVGHSMGGYVTMAFKEMFPELLKSYVLFHSTSFGDSEEKKASRLKDIELILKGQKEIIINSHVPRTFANINLSRLTIEIESAKGIAFKTHDQGIIASLNGMRTRPDRSHLLRTGDVPMLLIAGRYDNFIPLEIMEKMNKMAVNSSLAILDKSGHMGFIEEKTRSLQSLISFFNTVR